jgi:long-chain acyl-CoA synthetase
MAFDLQSLDSASSIPEVFLRNAKQFPAALVWEQLVQSDHPGQRISSTYAQECEIIVRLVRYLQSLGVKKGDKVALISNSRPEWMQADLAILFLGGITVSVYQSLPAVDVGYILFDSESEVVIVENEEQVEKIKKLASEKIRIPAHEDRPESEQQLHFRAIISIEECAQAQEGNFPGVQSWKHILESTKADVSELDLLCAQILREHTSTFVYTSGTTGPPKGVVQTHGNHLSNVRQVCEGHVIFPDDSILIFLPLAHSFARLMGYLGYLTSARLVFPSIGDRKSSKPNPDAMLRDIAAANVSVIPIVPRLLEKIKAGLESAARKKKISSLVLRLMIRAHRRCYQAEAAGRSKPLLANMLAVGLSGVREKVCHKLFGSNLRCLISGGAKLNPIVNTFFDMLGVEILQGYGLTETCVATNVNVYRHNKIGTVGPVLAPDIEVRIAEDAEICFRGPNITSSYYRRPTATQASWDSDGWFHTGDLGALDEENRLSIVGRKKEILVSSYGKKIAPEEIESRLKSISLISQAVLLGDGKAFCAALLTLDAARLKSLFEEWAVPPSDRKTSHPKVQAYLKDRIGKLNAELASHESVKDFLIVEDEFTVDNGMLTPTFKIKRKSVLERYADRISALYKD